MSSKIKAELIGDFHDGNILIAYQGVFDNLVLSVLAQNLEEKLGHLKSSKKLFKIFLELAQNVSFYSSEKTNSSQMGIGIFIIKENTNFYNIATGNIATEEQADNIEKHINHINSLNREGLRNFKRERRKMPHGIKGGANIGLIQVALTSENPLSFSNKKTSKKGLRFITIGARISK